MRTVLSWACLCVTDGIRNSNSISILLHLCFYLYLGQAVNSKFLESLMGGTNKAAYMFQDIERVGKFAKVPLRMPESPFYMLGVVGSLKQQRFLTGNKIEILHLPKVLVLTSKLPAPPPAEKVGWALGTNNAMAASYVLQCLPRGAAPPKKALLLSYFIIKLVQLVALP